MDRDFLIRMIDDLVGSRSDESLERSERIFIDWEEQYRREIRGILADV